MCQDSVNDFACLWFIFAFSMKEPADGRGVVIGMNSHLQIKLILKIWISKETV